MIETRDIIVQNAPPRRDRQKKKVVNIDTKEIFDSVNEASKSVGLSPAAIGNCCSGIRKTAGGFHWEYLK